MNVNLHIERVILEGVDLPWWERPQLQAAIELELTRLLAAGDFPATSGAQAYVAAGPIQLTQTTEPSQLGQQIAQAVYGGLGR